MMPVEPVVAPLARGWRTLFAVEIPLVAGAVLFWLLAPTAYLRDVVGVAAPGPAEVQLLRLYAGSVASLALGFYAWLLTQPAVHTATFRAFQVCLGVGDAAIIAASLARGDAVSHSHLPAAQIGMAASWLVVRVVYVCRGAPGVRTGTVPRWSRRTR